MSGRLPQVDYVGHIRRLEKAIISTLADFGLVGGQISGITGVWIQPDVASRCPNCPPSAMKTPSKIASIGVKVDSNGISQHGFSLNLDPDMSYWEGIIACDLPEHPSISMADLLNDPPSVGQVVESYLRNFESIF